jgi:hypothetical protein
MSDREDLRIKKTVVLQWHERHLRFDVAQQLFSSHQVDKGSRMLLESLDPAKFPDSGMAVDFGCGYGVLGVAWQAVKPSWTMHYVDRDALAVAFSRHNARQLGAVTTQFSIDVTVSPPPNGYNLVLWNVPGKAGRLVIAALIDVAIDALGADGLLAVVAVNPLLDLFTCGIERDDTSIEDVQVGKAHTVVHLRRSSGEVAGRDPFAEGLFDRPEQPFAISGREWRITPVIGLSEYDELSIATRLAGTLMYDGGPESQAHHWLVVEPGVGHLAKLASMLWPSAAGTVAGRDALALRSTSRALRGSSAVTVAIRGIEALTVDSPVDTAVVALPAQSTPDEIAAGIDAVERSVAPSAHVILHGRATEIARAERLLRRRQRWHLRERSKQRGFAAVRARVCLP